MGKNYPKLFLQLFVLQSLIFLTTCSPFEKVMMVSTGDVTNILTNSATVPGAVVDEGESAITVRGTCWATAAKPTTNNSKTTDGTGTGSFTSNLTGLIPGTTYYACAYATNNSGTVYGKEKSFSTKTIPVVISTDPANGTNNVALNKVINATFSEAMDPSTLTTLTFSLNDGISTVPGSVTYSGATVSFTPLSNFLPSKTYSCTITKGAKNQASIPLANDYLWSFTTSVIVVPSLTTNAATSITQTSAVSGGNISSDGGGTITSKGICWSTSANPTISDPRTNDGTGTASFTSNLSGLLPGTTYHLRAYAINSAGTGYGNDVQFTTIPLGTPTLSTTAATSITQTTAASGGNIASDGGAAITSKGVCWSTTANPIISDSKTIDGTGTASFTSNLSGLLPGTTYHIRAYAINSAGTGYGNDVQFTTNPVVVPTLTTTAASSITQTTAASGGNIASDGGGTITSKGVCWSTSSNPTISDSKTNDGTGTASFTSNLTGLLPGTTYHVRAYAINSSGPGYGNDVQFTTSPVVLATLSTTAVTSIALTTAVSGGNITNSGGGTITARGVCWSTTSNPTIANSITADGSGSGNFISTSTGLLQGTIYYLRAYATNSTGTAYGNQYIFSTKIADIELNTYNTIIIGTQLWMAENLKSTRYNNNTGIQNVTGNTAWGLLSTGAYCWYNNDAATYKATYGALYNWYTVNTDILCPTGWHVPSDNEWKTMEMFLGLTQAEADAVGHRGTDLGIKLKSTTSWSNGTNTSGFTALPAGDRSETGTFGYFGIDGTWWSSTPYDSNNSWYRNVNYNFDSIERDTFFNLSGFSVRCIKD